MTSSVVALAGSCPVTASTFVRTFHLGRAETSSTLISNTPSRHQTALLAFSLSRLIHPSSSSRTSPHVHPTPPPAHCRKAHRAPRQGRAQGRVRQRAHIPLMAPLYRRSRRPRGWTPQLRRQGAFHPFSLTSHSLGSIRSAYRWVGRRLGRLARPCSRSSVSVLPVA